MPRSLFFRLSAAFLLLLLVAMWVSVERSTSITENWVNAQVEEELLARARMAAEIGSQSTSSGLPLQPIAKRISQLAQTRVTLLDAKGNVLADSHRDPVQVENQAAMPEVAAALRGEPGEDLRTDVTGLNSAYVAIPWYPEHLPASASSLPLVVRISVGHQFLNRTNTVVHRSLLDASFWVILVGMALTLLIARYLSKPLQQMTALAKRVSEGDFSEHMPTYAADELGELAQALNKMASRLEEDMEQLSRRGNELATILASMSEGIIAIDVRGIVLHINPAAEQMCGLDETKLLRPLVEMIRNPDLVNAVEKAATTGERQLIEVEFFHPSSRIVDAVITPVSVPSSDPTGAQTIVVLRDVTELRHLERVRRDFAGNVSHELRTPLTAIKGFVETLKETEDAEERATYLGIIEEETDRLVAMVEDLLQLSRLEAPNRTIALEPVDPAEAVSHVAHLLQGKAEQKQQRLSVETSPVAPVTADTGLVEQVLLNLLDNAVKYTPVGGAITVRYREKQGFVRFEVADTGPGIAEADQERIFERFYRVDTARSRALGGTGLGLSIVKHIIEKHGGRTGVESRLGKGATFWFELPVARSS